MTSRLFRSVVASSGLLLAGCGSAVVSPAAATAPDAPEVDAGSPLAPDVVAPAPNVVVPAPDVVVLAPDVVDVVLEDARSQEIGWPTTKGVYCWASDGGPSVCCRGVADDGTPRLCCLPQPGGCAPCEADDAGRCERTDAAVRERP